MTSPSLSSSELRSALQRQSVSHPPLLIDVRAASLYRRSHIPGSHHIPSGLLLSGEFPDHDLVLVADSDQRAEQLIDALHGAGFHRRIQHLRGGIEAWREAGYTLQVATEAGPSSQTVKELIPILLMVGLATLALTLQHASILVFSLTLGLLLAPVVFVQRPQRTLLPLRRRSV